MNSLSSLAPEVLKVLLVLGICLQIHGITGVYGNYNTRNGIVSDKLNVHLVANTHDDVGWLKTIDQYFIGSNTSIQDACVENILDSLVNSLLRDPNRKFVYAEMAFFDRWWQIQSKKIQEKVKGLVSSGQLEFVNGGWCMHDEAATHYIDMIDQTTLGHDLIKKYFNATPRAGWQIDPFGHSAVQAYLLGAELGFDSVHFARIDYQDREQRKNNKTLEVVWRGSKTFGSSVQIFANAFPVHYSPPNGFEFEISTDYVPVQDNPLLFDYNVNQRVEDFVTAAQNQANVTRTNHIMWTMGGDFGYQYAESWFKEIDKLIHYVNKDGRVNALYSTPSIYTDAKNAANESWPLKTGDYFPYAEGPYSYWTGYFTSRPALKRYVRFLSGYYQAARQLEFLVGRNNKGLNTYSLGDALGIAQHHDAVTGTARQHTTDDYVKRLAIGASEAETVVNFALSYLVTSNSSSRHHVSATTLSQCGLLNISYCPSTEQHIPHDKNMVVVAYNPLGWERIDFIRIPVNDSDLVVKDSTGTEVESQYVELDAMTISLRKFHVEAYVGIEPEKTAKFWLVFPVSVPPLGWNTYFISKTTSHKEISTMEVVTSTSLPDNGTVVIGQGNFTLSFSKASGQLIRMSNSATGVDMPVQQEYLWYNSSSGSEDDVQASGAYVFRPDELPETVVKKSVPLKVVRGPLVDEIHQQFNSWLYQVFRVYKGKDHAEVEFTIGPIPTDDNIGKEVITQITANMSTNKVFYTDSNARDFLKRVRDHRSDWPLQVTQPVAGNYYPLNLGIYTADDHSELSVLVDRATGGSSIKDGQIELMLHRRVLNDDGKGVGEPLDETVCAGNDTCQGLTIRGNYYINVNKLGAGSRWRRTTGQEIYSPLLLAFTQENSEKWKSSHVSKATTMAVDYTLPTNVALITLQELSDGNVLLRLAHLYEANEDHEYSKLAQVELQKLFAGKTIKTIKETSLSANQEISQMKRLDWKVHNDEDFDNDSKPIRGGPVDSSNFIVQLGPMEIRTFLLSF